MNTMFVICDGCMLVNVDDTVPEIRSERSMFSLLKLPIICIIDLCVISGAASITFIESILSLYLEKQVTVSQIFFGH